MVRWRRWNKESIMSRDDFKIEGEDKDNSFNLKGILSSV